MTAPASQDGSTVDWETAVSEVRGGGVRIRGYDLADIIRELTYEEATFVVIRGQLPSAGEARAFGAVLCSILDHAFISSTIPAARFVVSANPDPIAGLAAGILTVGANTVSPQDSAELIDRVLAVAGDGADGLDAAAEQVAAEVFAEGRRVPGLGHPTHRDEDPRAGALREVAAPLGYWARSGEAMAAVQAAVERLKGRRLAVNVDGAAGAVLRELGFASPEIRCLGALSYVPGIIAHVTEELERAKGLRFVPLEQSRYVGVGDRDLPARASRGGASR